MAKKWFMETSRGCVYSGLKTLLNLIGLMVKANVLIDEIGHARISDFGLLKIISDPANPSSWSSCTQGGSTRWMSPELIDPKRFGLMRSRPTTFSDCYALGMVIYETISGHVPFHQEEGPAAIVRNATGAHPLRGVRFANGLWEMLEKCWKFQPRDRPCIEDVLQCLKEFSRLPVIVYPESDREEVSHCGDSDNSDSSDSLSGVPDPKVDMRMTEGAVASPSLDYLPGRPISKAHINIVGPKPYQIANPFRSQPKSLPALHPHPQTPRIESKIGSIHQVTTRYPHTLNHPYDIAQDPPTIVEAAKVAGKPGSNTRILDPHQASVRCRISVPPSTCTHNHLCTRELQFWAACHKKIADAQRTTVVTSRFYPSVFVVAGCCH